MNNLGLHLHSARVIISDIQVYYKALNDEDLNDRECEEIIQSFRNKRSDLIKLVAGAVFGVVVFMLLFAALGMTDGISFVLIPIVFALILIVIVIIITLILCKTRWRAFLEYSRRFRS